MKRFLELWKTLIIVKNTTENGIDTDSISGAIIELHINNKKGATWTRSLGKPSWLNLIST